MTLAELKQHILKTLQYALQKQSQQYMEADDDILTVGMMDYVLVNVFQNKISIEFEPNLRFYSRERHYAYDEVCEGLENFNQDDMANIADELRAEMEQYFLNNPNHLRFDYCLDFNVEYQTRHNLKNTYIPIIEQKFINTHHQSALQQSIHNYIEQILNRQNTLKNEQKIVMFAQYLCDFTLMQYDELQLIDVIENIIAHCDDIRTKKFKDKFIDTVRYELNQW